MNLAGQHRNMNATFDYVARQFVSAGQTYPSAVIQDDVQHDAVFPAIRTVVANADLALADTFNARQAANSNFRRIPIIDCFHKYHGSSPLILFIYRGTSAQIRYVRYLTLLIWLRHIRLFHKRNSKGGRAYSYAGTPAGQQDSPTVAAGEADWAFLTSRRA